MNARKKLKRRLAADRARPWTVRRLKVAIDAHIQKVMHAYIARVRADWRRLGLAEERDA